MISGSLSMSDETDRFTGNRQIEVDLQEADGLSPRMLFRTLIYGSRYDAIAGTASFTLLMLWDGQEAVDAVVGAAEVGGEYHGLSWLVDGIPTLIGTTVAGSLEATESNGPTAYVSVDASVKEFLRLANAASVEYRAGAIELHLPRDTQQLLKQALDMVAQVRTPEEQAEAQALDDASADASSQLLAGVILAIATFVIAYFIFR